MTTATKLILAWGAGILTLALIGVALWYGIKQAFVDPEKKRREFEDKM